MGLRFRFCLFAWSTEEFGDINKSCTYRILSVSAMKKGVQEKILCSFLLQTCDLRVPEAAGATAAGGREREPLQARNRERADKTQCGRAGDLDSEVVKHRFKSCLRNEKRSTRKNLVLFFIANL